jgi:hypothetical protein
VARYSDQGMPHGEWLRWARDGVLRERDEYREGKAHGLWQRFDEAGALLEEAGWRDGTRGGAYRRVGVPPELYADARVHEERGHFDAGPGGGARGRCSTAAGATLLARELGPASTDAALLASPALAEVAGTTRAAWEETARRLESEGRPAEAILAAARASAAGGRRRAARERPRPPRAAAAPRWRAGARRRAGPEGRRAAGPLSNGLPSGADAASLLRSLASSLVGRDLVALALVDAALLVAPDAPTVT